MGIASALFLSSLAIFRWAASTIAADPFELAFGKVSPRRLVCEGPYRWVRHPFYSAYLLAWCAFIVGSGSLLASVPLAVMATFYTCAIRQEEASFLETELGAEYARYRMEVGCLIPSLRRAS